MARSLSNKTRPRLTTPLLYIVAQSDSLSITLGEMPEGYRILRGLPSVGRGIWIVPSLQNKKCPSPSGAAHVILIPHTQSVKKRYALRYYRKILSRTFCSTDCFRITAVGQMSLHGGTITLLSQKATYSYP